VRDIDGEPRAARAGERDHFGRHVEGMNGRAAPCEQLAADAGSAAGVEHGQAGDVAEQRKRRRPFVKRVVRLGRRDVGVALGKFSVRTAAGSIGPIGHGVLVGGHEGFDSA